MNYLYRVEVFRRGILITEYVVEANSALAAIDEVELNYGSPPEVNFKTIHHENGSKETILMVNGWHGYCFVARKGCDHASSSN